MNIFETNEYKFVKELYGDKKAERSQVPYINHINEGLFVLDLINADLVTKKAYCLHGVFQSDNDFADRCNLRDYTHLDPEAILHVIEYRHVANGFLSKHNLEINPIDINAGISYITRDMLIADKVQNFKDFLQHHMGTHPRSKELYKYFSLWFQKLGSSKMHNLLKQLKENG